MALMADRRSDGCQFCLLNLLDAFNRKGPCTNDRLNIGIGGITSAQKLNMAAQAPRLHPGKNGGLPIRHHSG